MEDVVYINCKLNSNGPLTSNFLVCPTWEVVYTEDFARPLPCNIPPNESDQNYFNPTVKKSNKKNPKIRPEVSSGFKTNYVPEEPTQKPKKKHLFSGENKVGPNCNCPLKCFEKIGEEKIQKIFLDFWALADYNSQNAYLFGLINLAGVKRRYTKNESSRRNFTIVYHVKDKGQNVPVCKNAFLNIHGLQKNRGRINNLANKMKKGESVPALDKRGRHKNRPNAYSEEAVEHVRRHLLRCPKINRKVVEKISKQMVLSTRRCYALYVNEYCKNNGIAPVSLDKFRRVFAMEGYRNACKGPKNSEN